MNPFLEFNTLLLRGHGSEIFLPHGASRGPACHLWKSSGASTRRRGLSLCGIVGVESRASYSAVIRYDLSANHCFTAPTRGEQFVIAAAIGLVD
jgi:hypothetical protein